MNTEHKINLVRFLTLTPPRCPYHQHKPPYNLWVTMNRQNNVLPAGDKYLTRENVDLYFSHIVANRHDIQPATAHRTMSSLQSYEGRCDWHEVKN
jgi:hypothetical protein